MAKRNKPLALAFSTGTKPIKKTSISYKQCTNVYNQALHI